MIVEDGTIVPNANSYSTVAELDAYMSTYHPDDGIDVNVSTSEKESYLIAASNKVDLMYGSDFMSTPRGDYMLFPRYNFYDSNHRLVSNTTIPKELKNVVYELSLKLYNGEDIDIIPNNSRYDKQKFVKVGPIEIMNKVGNFNNVDENSERYDGMFVIEKMLKPLLKEKFVSNLSMVR